MENIARSLAQQIPPSWDLRLVVLFPFILDGNGRKRSARSPAFRAHLRIATICSTAFLQNQSENFGFISIAAGPATTTKRPAACETALSGKDTGPVQSSFTLLFPKRSTTRMHGLRAARFHFSSFLETCHGSQNRDNPRSGSLKVGLLFVVRVPKALMKIFSPAVWK